MQYFGNAMRCDLLTVRIVGLVCRLDYCQKLHRHEPVKCFGVIKSMLKFWSCKYAMIA